MKLILLSFCLTIVLDHHSSLALLNDTSSTIATTTTTKPTLVKNQNKTTKPTTTTTKTTTTTLPNYEPTKVNNDQQFVINYILDNAAPQCQQGFDPLISNICPTFKDILLHYDPLIVSNLKRLKLGDIKSYLIDQTTRNLLREKCEIGEWCLDKSVADNNKYFKNEKNIGSSFLRQHSVEFEVIAICYDKILSYIDSCAPSDIAKTLLHSVPTINALIKSSNQSKDDDYCLEKTFELLQVIESSFSQNTTDMTHCESEIKAHHKCNKQCRSIGLEVNRYESCCGNATFIRK
jgi:hypothetical protein